MRRCFSFFVSLRAAALLALLLAGCAARQDEAVWARLGVRPPVMRAEFERRLPRGWTHELRGFQGRVQWERYHTGPAEVYDVWSYPRQILTTHADDALMKIRRRELDTP